MKDGIGTLFFMLSLQSERSLKILFVAAMACYVFACVAFYFHAYDVNPQSDTQGIRYAAQAVNALHDGAFWQWLVALPARKYPMLYVAPFSILFELIGGSGALLPSEHLVARALTLLYAAGIFFLLRKQSLKMFGESRCAILLLFTSINFFMFATAVRPHMAVAFWTLLTYILSLHMREKKSLPWMLATFTSAGVAFATLQSGLLAFIFPILASLSEQRSPSNILKTVACTFIFFAAFLFIGYPFYLLLFSGHGPGSFDLSMGHDTGFQFFIQIIPAKMWMLIASDVILCLFAILSIPAMRREKSEYGPMMIYVAVFLIIFGMQEITSIRFFLPVLPFLALMGSKLLRGLRWAQLGLLVCIILAYARLGVLGIKQNTFQQASAAMMESTALLATNVPPYYLNLPDEKYALNSTPPSSVNLLLRPNEHSTLPVPTKICNTFTATDWPTAAAGTSYMFFWNDMQWPQFYLPGTKALGINMRLVCPQ